MDTGAIRLIFVHEVVACKKRQANKHGIQASARVNEGKDRCCLFYDLFTPSATTEISMQSKHNIDAIIFPFYVPCSYICCPVECSWRPDHGAQSLDLLSRSFRRLYLAPCSRKAREAVD